MAHQAQHMRCETVSVHSGGPADSLPVTCTAACSPAVGVDCLSHTDSNPYGPCPTLVCAGGPADNTAATRTAQEVEDLERGEPVEKVGTGVCSVLDSWLLGNPLDDDPVSSLRHMVLLLSRLRP